jgi:hypothetical protein
MSSRRLQMDLPPKEPIDASILDDLKKALSGADRCIELARRQRDHISRGLAAGEADAESRLLEHARERREQLEALERRVEMTPPPSLEAAAPPPVVESPAAVPVLEEQAVPV